MNSTPQSIFETWGITDIQLSDLALANPSLRGMLFGYVAELKFHDMFLNHPDISFVTKDPDSDRTKKGDRRIVYKGHTFLIEVKSVATKSIEENEHGVILGKAGVDASDKREVTFKDGTIASTSLLLRGEFDILAINCFSFSNNWTFQFAKNSDLPTPNQSRLTKEQNEQLITAKIKITDPPGRIFTEDLYQLLDELIIERENQKIMV